MIHEMHLSREAFEKIYSGIKTMELRINDHKIQEIEVGDTIQLILDENPYIKMEVKVVSLHQFTSLKEMYEELSLNKCGYKSDHKLSEIFHDMENHPGYSRANLIKFGIVGIEFEEIPWAKPYRNPFRMEPFLNEFENTLIHYWKAHPDYRFGQILTIFLEYIKQHGERDFYCLEEEDFLILLKQFVEDKCQHLIKFSQE